MRLGHIITLLPLCLTACIPFSNSEGDAQAEANNIGPCIEALESIAGDFDGDGTSDQATLYHIPEQTIPGDSLNLEQHIDESYYIAFDKESIARKTSSHKLSNLTLLGDINDDGKDELGVLTQGSQSYNAWGNYSALSNRGTEWQSIASTTLNVSLLESFGTTVDIPTLITIDSTRRGYIAVKHFTILDGESCEMTTETLRII
jgi:hypothetical protein